MKHRVTSGGFWLRELLRPLAGLYGAAVRVRNAYYDHRHSATHAAGVPVVSVGNMTVGGTGKTPFVIELVRRLRAAGHRPAILTRGYAAASRQTADEVLEFRLAVPEVPVVVNPDRVAGAAAARREHDADVLVLDDGFQHRRLRRDLDVVLIDALDAWGGGRLLPVGRLREPVSSLRRADWIVVTRANQADPAVVRTLFTTLAQYAPGVPTAKAMLEPAGFFDSNGSRFPVDALLEERVLPVCGLGNPETFLHAIERLAAAVAEPLLFADHHRYQMADVRRIVDAAAQCRAARVVTTRKDWVKLGALWPRAADSRPVPELLRLDVRIELADPHGEFEAALRRLFEVQV